MSIATLFSKLVAWLRNLLFGSSSGPVTTTPSTPTEPTKPPVATGTGNYYPEILRISTGSLELNGSRVGPEEHEVTITQKQKLYAAVTCEVQCTWSLACYLDGSNTAEQNMVTGNIAAANSGKEHAIVIGWPGTNGYPLGTHEAIFILYDQNGRACDSYSMTLNVVMP